MDILKKKFVSISKIDIENIKNLIRAYGATYYDAPCEADELCAMLTMKEKVWGCLSEDMDMFVYGCPRVIRQVSLLNHTCMFYDMEFVLKDLEMTIDIFRQIMVLSGSDYNVCENTNLHETIQWYYKYQKYLKIQNISYLLTGTRHFLVLLLCVVVFQL
jgi:5'-3' exonuclease